MAWPAWPRLHRHVAIFAALACAAFAATVWLQEQTTDLFLAPPPLTDGAEDLDERNKTVLPKVETPNPCQEGFDLVDGKCLFACRTSLPLRPVEKAAQKGLCVDDTTFLDCPERVPHRWPETSERVKSIRLFSAWKPKWPLAKRRQAWEGLLQFVRANDAKVLVGVEHTCNDHINDQEWEGAKEFLQLLGPRSVMGVAVGNEMELLHLKGNTYTSKECQNRLWKHRGFWKAFERRVEDLDRLPGFGSVPVTSVMGAFSLVGSPMDKRRKKVTPFIEKPYAMLNSFLRAATQKYGRRYAFSFNFYPYFDPTLVPDEGGKTCWGLLSGVSCLGQDCMVPAQAATARLKATKITGREDDLLWIGETGWSHPKSSTLETAMQQCSEWSSRRTFKLYYERFLAWDLSVAGARPPDHVFYFTMRDSLNFGMTEHFGLIASCKTPLCKLQASRGCHTAVPGDVCHTHVRWAKEHGIFEHPEWYLGLRPGSSFEDFQERLFEKGLAECSEPC